MVLVERQAATTTALLGAGEAGDEIVCSSAIYGGTLHLLADLLPRFGVTRAVRVARRARDARAGAVADATKLLWFESPINPTLRCVDIAAVAGGLPRARRDLGDRQHVREPDQPAAARARRRPRDAQRDEVPQRPQRRDRRRAGGPGDAARRRSTRRGGCSGRPRPAPAYALGARDEDADACAWSATTRTRSRSRSGSARGPARHDGVLSRACRSIPDHEIARQQMRGFGGMVCFDVGGGYERAARFFDRLQVFKRAASASAASRASAACRC